MNQAAKRVDLGVDEASEMAAARQAMVASQLRPNAVTDQQVLAAMAVVPREAFMPAERRAIAYIDRPVPLTGGRAVNPPMATGRLLSEAAPRAGERALVVGASTGYVAALLAHIGLDVVALEVPGFEAAASTRVNRVEGPLEEGWADGAPYDLIVIDGAVEQVPDALRRQLIDGGRLVTALVERGVTRLTIGYRAGEGFGMRAFADAEAVVLPGFSRPQAFTF